MNSFSFMVANISEKCGGLRCDHEPSKHQLVVKGSISIPLGCPIIVRRSVMLGRLFSLLL